MKRIAQIFVAVIAMIYCETLSAQSTSYTWVGGNGNWSQASNWMPAGIPTGTDNVSISAGNTVTIANGTNAQCGNMQVNGAAANIRLQNGASLNSTVGGINIINGATLTIDNGATLTATTATGRAMTANGSQVINNGLCNLTGASNGSLLLQSGASFTNNGTLNIGVSNRMGIDIVSATLTNNGTVDVNDRINVSGSGGPSLINNGVMDVRERITTTSFSGGPGSTVTTGGFFSNSSNFTSLGAYSPGYPPLNNGITVTIVDIPDFSNSTLLIDIAGTAGSANAGGHDNLYCNGRTLVLGGNSTLEVKLKSGYVPTTGDKFEIVSGDQAVTGTFANLRLPAAYSWQVNYNTPGTGDIELEYLGPSSSVPTLSQWGLIVLGLVVLCVGAVAIRRRNLAQEMI